MYDSNAVPKPFSFCFSSYLFHEVFYIHLGRTMGIFAKALYKKHRTWNHPTSVFSIVQQLKISQTPAMLHLEKHFR